jgi:hypothetical protein
MTADKKIVLLRGLLVGNGLKVLCSVQAARLEGIDGGRAVHTEYTILETAEPVPDGLYWLAVNSETLDAENKRGCWLIRS